MRVRVYREDRGDGSAEEYDATPQDGARRFAEKRLDTHGDLVVEPVDDDARALPGWASDAGGPFRMFKATSRVEWAVNEVDSFQV